MSLSRALVIHLGPITFGLCHSRLLYFFWIVKFGWRSAAFVPNAVKKILIPNRTHTCEKYEILHQCLGARDSQMEPYRRLFLFRFSNHCQRWLTGQNWSRIFWFFGYSCWIVPLFSLTLE